MRRRSDWQHQTTRTLADTYSLIGLEDLNVAGMVRSAKGTVEAPGRSAAQKAGLNRSIQGEAWHQLHTQLAYKTTERGGTVIVVPAPHTSLRCHRCGFSDVKNRKNQAVFACRNPTCGWVGNADTNAAHNIHHAAEQAAKRDPAQGRGVAGRGGRSRPGKRQSKRKGDPYGKP
ncbi:RNA-guided endonuclease InsQ/TnpB family protein [Nocardiopsis metallicus]|uniref:RNA-guided endonuclease InsQ/TnpB family protein n=1 Tax=Nocardiopsis metallicus TaxID=179819 RepID=UPI0028A72D7D|nr:transposase [Nocardiopsis metallicus]